MVSRIEALPYEKNLQVDIGCGGAQENPHVVREACIAHRGVDLAGLSFGAVLGAIFDFENLFIVDLALCRDAKKGTLNEALAVGLT
jgi:hypothetical protein